jgi:hypothetical protein
MTVLSLEPKITAVHQKNYRQKLPFHPRCRRWEALCAAQQVQFNATSKLGVEVETTAVLAAAQKAITPSGKGGKLVTATQAAVAGVCKRQPKRNIQRTRPPLMSEMILRGSADGDGSGEYLDQPGNQSVLLGRHAALYRVDAGTGIGEWKWLPDWPTSFSCRTMRFPALQPGTGVVAPVRGRQNPQNKYLSHYLCAKPAIPTYASSSLRLIFLYYKRPCL